MSKCAEEKEFVFIKFSLSNYATKQTVLAGALWEEI
jgi:hypothetical protein